MSQKPLSYAIGYHESVLRMMKWRTVANSAEYLLDSILPHMKILDVGCGPGTITVDFATLVPDGRVIGLDYTPEVLDVARETANERGLENVQFVVGNIYSLDYPDDTFDVVHAHQVFQHLADPLQALREMRRVAKPGGIIAIREMVMSTIVFYPELKELDDWLELYLRMARSTDGEPNAGRRLHAWARQVGFDAAHVTPITGSWCYNTPQEREWWSSSVADSTVSAKYAQRALDGGYATGEDLARIAQGWRDWGAHEDGWFAVLHCGILCRV